MDHVQVEKYGDVWRAIIRQKIIVRNFEQRQTLLSPADQRSIRDVLALLENARLICIEVFRMEAAKQLSLPSIAQQRYDRACELAQEFWGCALALGIHHIYNHEFLNPIVEDFPAPF